MDKDSVLLGGVLVASGALFGISAAMLIGGWALGGVGLLIAFGVYRLYQSAAPRFVPAETG